MQTQVTVFRSADANAQEDAEAVREMLADQGVAASLLDDRAPGVPSGAWEVRVAATDSARAEALIAATPLEDDLSEVDASHDLDLVTVFRRGAGSTSEMEALAVRNLLEANGISTVLVGDAPLPNLAEEVRVASDCAEEARRLIAEALASGPQAAEAAEAAGEADGAGRL